MALLVNYNGAYTEPQKLWYLVDSEWKEVVNVFESPIQQELAVIDEERIFQDKTVLSLSTKLSTLNAQITGSDPTISKITDVDKIDLIYEEIEVVELQLEVATIEQVAITKQLFEQKAQVEYKKLVLQGEAAINKITNIVTNVGEWGIIRLDPQGPLDERMELVIQHNLDTNERIFNYGAVYYRLYKLNQIENNDNLEYLYNNFKRRLAKTEFANDVVATNFIMTTMDIEETFSEVSTYISSGTDRIINFLASIQDQQQYILDNMETVKSNLFRLEEIGETSNLVSFNDDGLMITNSTTQTNVLGSILFKSQGTTVINELISQEVLYQIEQDPTEADNYPSLFTFQNNVDTVAEKIVAVSSLKEANDNLLADIEQGVALFDNISVLTDRQEEVDTNISLFWANPLGDSTIAKKGNTVNWTEGYTSNGTHKFRNTDLLTLKTLYTAIINSSIINTKESQFGVGTNPQNIAIINVEEINTITLDVDGLLTTYSPPIVETREINTKSILPHSKINDKDQGHDAIPFVKANNSKLPKNIVTLSLYQPSINTVFFPITKTCNLNGFTAAQSIEYDRALMVYQLPVTGVFNDNLMFNTKIIPRTEYTRMVTQHKTYSDTEVLFNIKEITVEKTNFLVKQEDFFIDTELVFNTKLMPTEKIINIIKQMDTIEPGDFTFNVKEISTEILNGYSQSTDYSIIDATPSAGNVIIEITETELLPLVSTQVNNEARSIPMTTLQEIISSQTGLQVMEFTEFDDTLNFDPSRLTKIASIQNNTTYIPNDFETVNIEKTRLIRMADITSSKTRDPEEFSDTVNIEKTRLINMGIYTSFKMTELEDAVNLDTTRIISQAVQLNPELVIE